LVRPVTVWVVAVDANVCGGCAAVPTYGVTTYPVSGEPLSAGATHDTDADPFPDTAVGGAGGAGVPTVTAPPPALRGPVLFAFFAATRNVYVVPFVRPVITWVVAVDANVRAGWAVVPMNGVTT
jgi:hypothetical protein